VRFVLGAVVGAFASIAMTAPAAAAWQEARSPHFLIYADEPAAELQGYAERLDLFDKAVRTVRDMSDPPLNDPDKVTVFVVPTLEHIEKLAGGSGVAGFYLARASGSVAFVPRVAGTRGDEFDLDPDAIFFHEYSHHLQLQTADVALPPWVSEGFAEFFARTNLRPDGSVVIGVPPAYRAWSLFEYNSLSLRRMLGADTHLSDTDVEGIYSRGWLLTHYLTFNRTRKGQLEKYIASIQQGVPPLNAAQLAFGDLDGLANEIDGYVRNKKLPTVVLTGLTVPRSAIRVRQLSPAQGAMMWIHIRTEAGATHKTAGDIASDARSVAAKYPGEPFVQTCLAQAEYDAKNYSAAEAAADRALALDPQGLSALVAKGKAELQLARQSPGNARWSEIRKLFIRANKIDSEAPEPLALFYQSYAMAGEPPTKNALDALTYALTLVPQDPKLRLIVVHELLAQSDTQAARRYFAAFAYEPHATSRVREAAADAMTAMEQGRKAEALKDVAQIQEQLDKDDG
jgi:tetratricopeptide (TPR) repeat protein